MRQLKVTQGVRAARSQRNDVVDVRLVEAHRATADGTSEVLAVQKPDAYRLRPSRPLLASMSRLPDWPDLDGEGALRGVQSRLVGLHERHGKSPVQGIRA